MNDRGHNQEVIRVLIKMLVRFGIQGERGRVPDNLINADSVQMGIIRVRKIVYLDKEHRVAVDRAHVNRSIKGYGEARLQIESIELVQQLRINAVRGPGRTVGQRQLDTQVSILSRVAHRKTIAGKRRLRELFQVEQGMNVMIAGKDSRG